VGRSKTESYIGVAILMTLGLIAAGVATRQSLFDERIFTVAVSQTAQPVAVSSEEVQPSRLAKYVPAGMKEMTPVEWFNPETLSEKINGKAELYLSAGFVSLVCQRFMVPDHPGRWLEAFVYDMGGASNAFSVFSVQQRAEAQPADLTPYSYRTPNTLFMTHGNYYVEIIASTDDLGEAMLAWGAGFVRENPVETEEMAEMTLFPRNHLVANSIALLAEDVFGCAELNRVFIARYAVEGVELTAFLSRRADRREAEALMDGYRRFLIDNGGAVQDLGGTIPDGWVVKIFDTYEVVFVQRDYLAGVHEAENAEEAMKLARDLRQRLGEGVP
jgi:hypothetical protein